MKKLSIILLLVLLLVGCQNEVKTDENDNLMNNENTMNESNTQDNNLGEETEQNDAVSETENEVDETQETEDTSQVNETQETEVAEETEETEETIDLTSQYLEYNVNESGQIMVIMYHDLREKASTYATTVELFKNDLNRLYEEGYRTISMSDYINNEIDIPIGTTPVILTFDDATLSNFHYDEAGDIAQDSVVGILNEFYEEHEDFGRNAIFYVYGQNPFRERSLLEDKLNYLIENGYEIGNHSYDHEKLNTLDQAGIIKAIGGQHAFIKSLVDYDMMHVSLPYGIRPSETLIEFVFSGTYEEVSYNNVSAVNVGWNPTKSPLHKDFNPRSINRITCGDDDFELTYWMDYFKEHPEKRYISDGDEMTHVVPESQLESVHPAILDTITSYDDKEE